MARDQLERDLEAEIARIPIIDPHSHIDPHRPTSRSLDDILGYHYYTELAHSAGMDKAPLDPAVPPRERVRAVLSHMDRFDNTAQYAWFLEIARTFLGFQGDKPHRGRRGPAFRHGREGLRSAGLGGKGSQAVERREGVPD